MTGPAEASGPATLIRRADSVLVVVDMQTGFFDRHASVDRDGLAAAAARAAWVVGVAVALDVPVVITEEDPVRNGRTDGAILDQVPRATPIFEKLAFGLAGQPEILAAVEASGRRTAVLVGTETDVCVAQSALGLIERGFRVAVVVDATFSPGEMHGHGLRRMTDAGVIATHAKGLYYEWVGSLAEARRFEADHPELAEPPGFSL